MIFLDVKDYCQNNCESFEADVEKTGLYADSKPYVNDTIVRCKHRELCERMRIQFSHPNEEDLK